MEWIRRGRQQYLNPSKIDDSVDKSSLNVIIKLRRPDCNVPRDGTCTRKSMLVK
jgi:hypothetical protein